MSVLDKAIAAVTPPESAEARAEARAKAQAAARPGGWLAAVLSHHIALEAAFGRVRAAEDARSRKDALKSLSTLLTGHSLAEEVVLYPAMAQADEKAHATLAYTEQTAAKMQAAALDEMDPLSEDFMDKLGHLQGAVEHHMYEEEKGWFLDLAESDQVDQAKLTARYAEEFGRYMGSEAPAAA